MMADDIKVTKILSPLSATAKIRRVKGNDPENERRSPEGRKRRHKKNKSRRAPPGDSAAIKVVLQKEMPAENPKRTDVLKARSKEAKTKADGADKAIDIRV